MITRMFPLLFQRVNDNCEVWAARTDVSLLYRAGLAVFEA